MTKNTMKTNMIQRILKQIKGVFSRTPNVRVEKKTKATHFSRRIKVTKYWYGTTFVNIKRPSKLKPVIRTKGLTKDLKRTFSELNNDYFSGTAKAKVTWGRYGSRNISRNTFITFSSYCKKENLIRIHPSLDSKNVPQMFLETEMLKAMHLISHPLITKRKAVYYYDDLFFRSKLPEQKTKEAHTWAENNRSLFIAQLAKQKL